MTGSSWTCPFCKRATTIVQNNTSSGDSILFYDSKYGLVGIRWGSLLCPNPDCGEVYLRVVFEKLEFIFGTQQTKLLEEIQIWTLRPESNAKPQPDYIPKQIQEDYKEACLIAEKSPKASATLSRRCLQGMIRDFWKIKKNRLIDEINALEKLVDPNTWAAIKAVKDVGNIGAHMEKDTNLIIQVDPAEARLLIEMIEQLFEDWYVLQHQREERMKNTIAMAKKKNKQRKQGPAP